LHHRLIARKPIYDTFTSIILIWAEVRMPFLGSKGIGSQPQAIDPSMFRNGGKLNSRRFVVIPALKLRRGSDSFLFDHRLTGL